tara:strand:+ start:79 stop:465 length:387 start_codon:yes stop_codon:yes gene_type:complete
MIARPKGAKGFTLIEILVSIVIVGILAAIAIPQFSVYRKRTYGAQIKLDLVNAATAQEAYLVENNDYSIGLSGINSMGYNQHANITLGIVGTSVSGFRLTAGHTRCTAGTWNYDSASAGTNITGGPCG